MHKSIKWSSQANLDFEKILLYLEARWNYGVCTSFINKIDFCLELIQKNPRQFPLISNDYQIRRCVVTKQNTLYYRETTSRIEVLRL